MELLYEFFLTISFSFIFTSLFIKLFSTSPNITDNDDLFFSEKTLQQRQYYPGASNNSAGPGSEVKGGQMYAAKTEETLQMDKFQWVPIKDDVMIKLEECHDEDKSKVELHNKVIRVEKEVKLRDVEVVDGKKCDKLSLEEENGYHNEGKESQMYAAETGEILQMDKFQWVPIKNEVIKLEKCHDKGKSKVEFHKVIVGVEKEVKLRDIEVVDSKKGDESSLEKENYNNERGKGGQIYVTDTEEMLQMDIHEEVIYGLEKKDELDRKMCEIEIESVEENEEIMDDWEEIGRKDFEEIIVIKEGLYDLNVSFSGLNNFDVVHGK